MKRPACRRIVLTGLLMTAAYAFGVVSRDASLFPARFVDLLLHPYRLRPYAARGYRSTQDREQVPCRRFRERTAVMLAFGQSNAANDGEPGYVTGPRVYNFNHFDGRCYAARDPLLGASGSGGSVWTRLGDKLVRAGVFEQVLFVPVAVGGTAVADWLPGGGLFDRIVGTHRELTKHGLRITHLLWHQGETDAGSGTSAADYFSRFETMERGVRALGIDAPLYVAVASLCWNQGNEEIRQAQQRIIRTLPNAFAGPDTDTLDRFKWRRDLCHFSAAGLEEHARLWFEALVAKDGPGDDLAAAAGGLRGSKP
jgi:hypothetical protein